MFLDYELSIYNDFNKDTRIGNLKQYYNTKRILPPVVKVEISEDFKSLDYYDIMENIRTEYIDSNEMSFEFPYYCVSGKYLMFSSWYSDRLYIFDHTKMELVKKLKINSDYTPIGGKAFKITQNNLENQDEFIHQRGSFNGLINSFFYDDINDLLFVMVYHEQKDKNSNIYGAGRPWSLLVYNSQFEKIHEEAFEHDEYQMGHSILTSKGLMIRDFDKEQIENNKRSDKKILTFDLFDFSL